VKIIVTISQEVDIIIHLVEAIQDLQADSMDQNLYLKVLILNQDGDNRKVNHRLAVFISQWRILILNLTKLALLLQTNRLYSEIIRKMKKKRNIKRSQRSIVESLHLRKVPNHLPKMKRRLNLNLNKNRKLISLNWILSSNNSRMQEAIVYLISWVDQVVEIPHLKTTVIIF